MRYAAIYVGPDFVGDRWQHFRLQLRLNVVNLEYLTIYICATNRKKVQAVHRPTSTVQIYQSQSNIKEKFSQPNKVLKRKTT